MWVREKERKIKKKFSSSASTLHLAFRTAVGLSAGAEAHSRASIPTRVEQLDAASDPPAPSGSRGSEEEGENAAEAKEKESRKKRGG